MMLIPYFEKRKKWLASKPATVALTMRMDPVVKAKADALAARHGVPIVAVVEAALEVAVAMDDAARANPAHEPT